MLAILFLATFAGASQGAWRLDGTILVLLLATTSASLLFMLNGLLNQAPGALRVGTVFVVWPILYVFFAGFFRNPDLVVGFEKVIILGIIVSSAMGILLVGEALSGHNWGIYSLFGFQGAAVGVYKGYVEYRLYNMTTLIYGFSFLITLVMLNADRHLLFRNWNLLIWVGILLALLTAALSGRRAFWLVIILSPFIVSGFFLISGQRRCLKRMVATLGVFIAILMAMFYVIPVIDLSGIGKEFISAFDVSGEYSSGIRHEQFQALLSEWMKKPFLGHGAGASVQAVIRNESMLWAYELSYVALLYHTGIAGMVVYGAAVLWIFVSGTSTVRRKPEAAPVILPLLAALAGFLIVNATNPYLEKFDYLWTLFLPVAAINAYRSEADGSISSSSTGIPGASSATA